MSRAFTSPPTTSPRWIEPDESLNPGEYLLGGSTSTNLARGRIVGYGLYFTNRRIIGIKRKGIGVIILGAASILGLIALLLPILLLHEAFFGLLSPLFFATDPLSRYLTQKFGEKFLSVADKDKSRQLKRKRDFATRREEISALYLSKASKKAWKFDIVFKDREKKDVRININDRIHYQILRDLVEAFSKLQPTIYFHEY